jgi:hypothetical protein
MKNVLCFIRPGFDHGSKDIAKIDNVNCFTISDFKGVDQCDFVRRQQKKMLNFKSEGFLQDIESYENVIYRDRYLSNLSFHLAKRLINSAWFAIDEIFKEKDVHAFIGFPIDNYILDLIDRYCYRYNIPSINPVISFLEGFVRVTRRGEHVKTRYVSNDEVSKYLEIFSSNEFTPHWLPKCRSTIDLFKLYLRERVKKVYFLYKKNIEGHKYSFHYNCIYPYENIITVRSFNNILVSRFFVKDQIYLEKKISHYSKVVFLPLQVAPETSLNYLIEDYRFADYHTLVNKVIDSMPEGAILLLKEHPAYYGYRDYDFYKKFSSYPNVLFIDPGMPINYLFSLIDLVVVTGNASTGAEAILKGINVVSLGGAFYSEFGLGRCVDIKSYFDISMLKEIVLSPEKFFSCGEFDDKTYVSHLLEGMISGRDLAYKYFDPSLYVGYELILNYLFSYGNFEKDCYGSV